MRLRLRLPDGWTHVDQPHQRIALLRGDGARPIALIACAPLAPAAPPGGLRDVLAVELGGAQLELDDEQPQHTEDGWTYVTRGARVYASDGLIETRLAAHFRFAEWHGVAVARLLDPDRGPALEPIVRAAFASATPDWRGDGEVACVAHLYDPVVE